jgi:hypothetical protein
MGYRMLPKMRRNFLVHRLFCQAIHGPRRRGHRISYLGKGSEIFKQERFATSE